MTGTKPLIIYGNGAMAKLVCSFAQTQYEVTGFTVDDHCIQQTNPTFCSLPLFPFSEIEQHRPPTDFDILIAIGFVDMNDLREQKYQEAKAKGYSFASYVHESLVRHDGVAIEENCIVLDHVSVHPGSTIARSTFIASNVNIGHDCRIEHSNWINAGVSFGGGCTVGSRCFFGINSCVAHGVALGDQTFVGANTLIARNTAPQEVYLSEPGVRFKLNSKRFLKFSPGLNP